MTVQRRLHKRERLNRATGQPEWAVKEGGRTRHVCETEAEADAWIDAHSNRSRVIVGPYDLGYEAVPHVVGHRTENGVSMEYWMFEPTRYGYLTADRRGLIVRKGAEHHIYWDGQLVTTTPAGIRPGSSSTSSQEARDAMSEARRLLVEHALQHPPRRVF